VLLSLNTASVLKLLEICSKNRIPSQNIVMGVLPPPRMLSTDLFGFSPKGNKNTAPAT